MLRDIGSMKTVMAVGGVVALGAAVSALRKGSMRQTQDRQKEQEAQVSKVGHETIHLVVDATFSAEGERPVWIACLKRMLDLGFCPQRAYFTILVARPDEANWSGQRLVQAMGRRYQNRLDHVRLVFTNQPTSVRRLLWAIQSCGTFHHTAPVYTGTISGAAAVSDGWDQRLIAQSLQQTQQWRTMVLLSSPIGEGVSSEKDGRGAFAAFSAWHPVSGAPMARVVPYPEMAAPSSPFVGQTAFFSTELAFGLTKHWQFLQGRLAQAAFWKRSTPVEEWADRYRVAVTAFEAGIVFSTLQVPVAVQPFGLEADETHPDLWLRPLGLPPVQAGSNPGMNWPLSAAFGAYSGMQPRNRTASPFAALGLANLVIGGTDWQRKQQRVWMDKQMCQRYGSVREVQRRMAIIQNLAATVQG